MKIYFLIFAMCIALLCSCSRSNGSFALPSEDEKRDRRMEQILEILQKDDPDALEVIFSSRAKNEAVNFEGNVEYLFDFFCGDVIDWNCERFTSGMTIEHGHKSERLISWFSVTTNQNEYKFFMIDYPEDTITPDNAGLYALRVIKAENEDVEFSAWQEMQIPGVYKP